MALAPGTRLGPYEISAQIGVGGMGEVYRATDTNLGRPVAIKVLPGTFAEDVERVARFEREAKMLAALNHPNIAQIYGFEKANGIRALIMELVDGATLADRIAAGPIRIDEALPIAKQLAEAIEAAHEQGIVHRDLKPANIKLRADGKVKVLDFGLAKLTDTAGTTGASVAPSNSPTITSPAMMTGIGMLLGTAAYMSPEQAKGRPADGRSDIWAFGCVLYEMLTGRRAFDGEDMAEVLGAVVRSDPDWTALASDVPSRVAQVIRACLQKKVKERVAHIQDVRLALDGVFETPAPQVAAPAAASPTFGIRRAAMLAAGALFIGGVIAGAAVWMAMRPAAPPVVRTEITTSGAAAMNLGGQGRDVVVTPDGSRIVYRGARQILVRPVDQLDPAPLISDLANVTDLFVSPDGQWVGFFDGTALKKVAITGGPVVTVCDANGLGRGATWGEDGTIIFSSTGLGAGLQRVSAGGGVPTALTTPNRDAGEQLHRQPEFLPGGRAVLFTIAPVGVGGGGATDNLQIAVLDLQNGTQKRLIRGGSHARYLRSGHLVYAVAGTLRAVAFDLERLEVTGTAVPVVPDLVTKIGGAADFGIAENGTLVYARGSAARSGRRRLVWVDRKGREEPIKAPERAYIYPRMSPDGTRVALALGDQQDDIWVWNLARGTLTRITFDPAPDSYPVWTPDGQRVIFGSPRDGEPNLFWQAADGTGAAERLTKSALNQQAFSISPDGKRIMFREGLPPYDLKVLLLGSERRTEPLIQTPFNEGNAEVSPDGRWLAYESDESGQGEVYVRPFPNITGGRWQVSTAGGSRPLWARNSRELFYVAAAGDNASLMSVGVQSDTTWTAATPMKVFAGRFFFGEPGLTGQGRTYDVAPDGQRFLMIKDTGDDPVAPPNIVVVQNWMEELKRLVPTN